MVGRGFSAGASLVLVLILAFHGVRLAVAQVPDNTGGNTGEPTPKEKGIELWKQALAKYAEAADNGLQEGAPCDKSVEGVSRLLQYHLALLVGKTAEQLEDQFKEEGALRRYSTEYKEDTDTELQSALDAVDPKVRETDLCATAKNLFCKKRVCRSCDCAKKEEDKDHCSTDVAKVVKDRNLQGIPKGNCDFQIKETTTTEKEKNEVTDKTTSKSKKKGEDGMSTTPKTGGDSEKSGGVTTTTTAVGNPLIIVTFIAAIPTLQ